jgi:hypothetical protein
MMDHKDLKEEQEHFAELESKNRQLWVDDLKFGWGNDHWSDKDRKARETDPDGPRPCITVNKLPTHARQIINNMRQARAAIRVLPVDDYSDVETAKMIQGLIRHIEQMSNAEAAYSNASEFQVMMGLGFWRVDNEYTNEIYGEQDLRINTIRNPFSVYMDPYIQDSTGADASSCYIVDDIPRVKFKRMYPKADKVDYNSDVGASWATEKTVRIAENWHIIEEDDPHVMAKGKAMRAKDYESDSMGEVQREIAMKAKKLKWCMLNGSEILEEQEKPGIFIPIVRVVGEDITIEDERMVCGIVRRAKDSAMMYSYTTSALAERNGMEPKAPWVASWESTEAFSDDWADSNRSNRAVLHYNAYTPDGNPLPPPQRQFPGGANGGLLTQLQMNDADLKATTGQFAANMGEAGNETSKVAIQQRQAVGDVATYHYPDNMSRSIRQTGRILIDLLPHYYDTKRVARVLGDDDEPKQVQLDPNSKKAFMEKGKGKNKQKIYNISVGKYDVISAVGPSYATRRQEGMDRMAAYMSTNPNLWGVIGDLAVKLDDSPYSQEMAERIRNTIPPEIRGNDDDEGEQMDPEVAAAFQQMQAGMQQLQQEAQQLAQANQEMQQTIQGKVIEQQTKAADHQMKMQEMQQAYALKAMEMEQKQAELVAKQQEAQMSLTMTAEKNVAEFESIAELVQVASSGAASNQEILLALAQSTQQNGEMLAAMLQEMGRPKSLSVTTDADGNITGGVSHTLQ